MWASEVAESWQELHTATVRVVSTSAPTCVQAAVVQLNSLVAVVG